MVWRELYTAARSHDLPGRQRPPHWSFMNLTADAETDGACGLLQYRGESEALFVLDKFFMRRARRLPEVSPYVARSPDCGRHSVMPGGDPVRGGSPPLGG